ncbi:HAD-IC family P-type ATPase [Lactobacillus sp. Sy-1]|uniref:HAD-IC family P-type ATPase n=1 Tax=Lactobacillus sp. Sy-1 TaxID=2109645 RepID=UPI00210434AF|nr:HAD-IC family P-type ATPase [Lactobacillus sp. Sy-1]
MKDFKLTDEEIQNKYQIKDFESGLTSSQASERLAQNGPNELQFKKDSKLKLFLRQFNEVIIYVLILSAIITLLMRHYSDSLIITLVVLANAIIGYYQEANASNALDKIRSILATNSTVYRDGKRIDIPTNEIVVGDVVFLEAGDRVPADLRLVDTDNLRIQESALTGESDSIEKDAAVITEDHPSLAEQANIAFSYTSVTSGSGTGVVIATGNDTEIGQISQEVNNTTERKTPLMNELDQLGKWVSYVIMGVSVILFLIGLYFETYSVSVLALAVVAMVVGSIPEGLPATTSVVLSRGVSDMAKNKNTIVKSLPAVETLGSVDVVATDKTGTLTQNEMTATDVLLPSGTYHVTGTGYQPDGQILDDNDQPVKSKELQLFLDAGFEANDTTLNREDGRWEINGEPTDGAFLTLYHKGTQSMDNPQYQEVDLLPFDSAFRYMGKVVVNPAGQKFLFVKGAPDKVLALAKKTDPNFDTQAWEDKVHALSKTGKRVIAVGYKPVADNVNEINHELITSGIQFLGLAGIIDPPREEVVQALKEMNAAGVEVKMITGDNPVTAKAIGEKLGLAPEIHAITGAELDQLNDEEFTKAVLENQVFARTTPQNKLQIIKALQAAGKVTAMTGDGINDAPALKRADIGVAMGIKGTDVAKDSADMVLTDDNFGTLSTAIREGRRIYDNIKKSIRFLLPTSFAEGLIIAFTILTKNDMPLNATQLLWINMVSAITIQFVFIFEPAEKNIMLKKPRDNNSSLLSKADMVRMAYISSVMAICGIVVFDALIAGGWSIEVASTVVVNVIVFGKIFYLFYIRTSEPLFSKSFFSNPAAFWIIGLMICFQFILTYVPFMQDLFKTDGMPLSGWLISIAAGIVVLALSEVDKLVSKRLKID